MYTVYSSSPMLDYIHKWYQAKPAAEISNGMYLLVSQVKRRIYLYNLFSSPAPSWTTMPQTPKAFYTRSDLCHKPSTPEIRLHQHLCARSWRKIWNLFTPATFAWRAWHMTPKAVYSRSPFQSFHTRNLTMQNAMRIRACKHKNTATLEVGF